MKKKWLLVTGTVILIVSFAALALAANPIKLIVNGQEIKPDLSPQVINGRVMVPVRWVADALGAEVKWSSDSNTVIIDQNSRSTGSEQTLTAKEKAKKLQEILTRSIELIDECLKENKDIGAYDLAFGTTYNYLHIDYTQFNNLFFDEFEAINTLPSLKEIDIAYLSALKSIDYPGDFRLLKNTKSTLTLGTKKALR